MLPPFALGMVCVAQYTEDKAWYRAIVSGLPGRQNVQVTYVDFGNEEIVPYFKLKKILDKFVSLPVQVRGNSVHIIASNATLPDYPINSIWVYFHICY